MHREIWKDTQKNNNGDNLIGKWLDQKPCDCEIRAEREFFGAHLFIYLYFELPVYIIYSQGYIQNKLAQLKEIFDSRLNLVYRRQLTKSEYGI